MAKITCSSEAISAKFMLILFTVLFFLACSIEAQRGQLPQDEVDALKEIAGQLKIDESAWNFSLNPCDIKWNASDSTINYNRSIICNCSFAGGVCHVEKIFLKGMDLAGQLPRSLPKLRYLKAMDLTRNYLSGTIPKEWVSCKLEYLSLIVNRLSGPIPAYLGDMTTLIYLSLENNMFNGTVPAALGKLANLENLVLNANNLIGELPKELYDLTKLTEIRLSGNNFIGKISNFLKWKNLEKLELQASGFEGPIPSNISTLKNLTELRISDLKGSSSAFPQLRDMTNMKNLMLRSCKLSGKIDLVQMTKLKNLDLSFNNLEGGVPFLDDLKNLVSIYLTGNFLSGKIPYWINNAGGKLNIDLSYNNFSENSVPETCRENLNLYRSFGGGNHSKLAACLKSCSKVYYSVYINCGGREVKVEKSIFEADEESTGSAK